MFYIRRQPRNVPGSPAVHPDVIAAAARAEMRRQQLAEQRKHSPAAERWGQDEDDVSEQEAERIQKKLQEKNQRSMVQATAGLGPGSSSGAAAADPLIEREAQENGGAESSGQRDAAVNGASVSGNTGRFPSDAAGAQGSGGILGMIRRAAVGMFYPKAKPEDRSRANNGG